MKRRLLASLVLVATVPAAGQAAWGPAEPISGRALPQAPQNPVAIALTPSGDAAAAWIQGRGYALTGPIRVATRRGARGAWSAPVRLSGAEPQSAPAVAAGPGRRAIVVWGEGGELRAARRARTGRWRALPRLAGVRPVSVRVALRADGFATALITSGEEGRWTLQIAEQRGLEPWRLVGAPLVTGTPPEVDLLPYGRVVAAWRDARCGLVPLRAALRRAGGLPWEAPSLLSSAAGAPSVDLNARGDAAVAWVSRDPCLRYEMGPPFTAGAVDVAVRGLAGDGWPAPVRVAEDADGAAAVGLGDSGHLALAWPVRLAAEEWRVAGAYRPPGAAGFTERGLLPGAPVGGIDSVGVGPPLVDADGGVIVPAYRPEEISVLVAGRRVAAGRWSWTSIGGSEEGVAITGDGRGAALAAWAYPENGSPVLTRGFDRRSALALAAPSRVRAGGRLVARFAAVDAAADPGGRARAGDRYRLTLSAPGGSSRRVSGRVRHGLNHVAIRVGRRVGRATLRLEVRGADGRRLVEATGVALVARVGDRRVHWLRAQRLRLS